MKLIVIRSETWHMLRQWNEQRYGGRGIDPSEVTLQDNGTVSFFISEEIYHRLVEVNKDLDRAIHTALSPLREAPQ